MSMTPVPLRAAVRIAVVHGARGQRAHERERARHEDRLRVQRIDLVTNREAIERLVVVCTRSV